MIYLCVMPPDKDFIIEKVHGFDYLIELVRKYEDLFIRQGWVINHPDIRIVSENSIEEAWLESQNHLLSLISYHKSEVAKDGTYMTLVNSSLNYENLIFSEELKRVIRLEKLDKL